MDEWVEIIKQSREESIRAQIEREREVEEARRDEEERFQEESERASHEDEQNMVVEELEKHRKTKEELNRGEDE
jgi:hypothetical protein